MDLLNISEKQAEAARKAFKAGYEVAVIIYKKEVSELKEMEAQFTHKVRYCEGIYNEILTYDSLMKQLGTDVVDVVEEYQPIATSLLQEAYKQVYNKIDDIELSTNKDTQTKADIDNTQIDTNEEDNLVVDTRTGKRKMGVQKRVQEILMKEDRLLATGEIVKLVRLSMGSDTTYSSITNSLIRLVTFGVFEKTKSDNGANYYGLKKWFNADGEVKQEYKEKSNINPRNMFEEYEPDGNAEEDFKNL